jgi:hypothetical protein
LLRWKLGRPEARLTKKYIDDIFVRDGLYG